MLVDWDEVAVFVSDGKKKINSLKIYTICTVTITLLMHKYNLSTWDITQMVVIHLIHW